MQDFYTIANLHILEENNELFFSGWIGSGGKVFANINYQVTP